MLGEIRSRLFVLVGLTILGVALAGMGTALGVTELVTDSDSTAEFVVSEENVTFSDGGEEMTVVDDMSDVRELRIEERESRHFTIRAERDQPLSEDVREHAKKIARSNETVQRYLRTVDGHVLTVDPVRKLDTSSIGYESVSVTNGTADSFTIEDATSDSENGTVVVERDPSYVEDRAVVRVQRSSGDARNDLKYTIDVDLRNETVTDITDWDEVRRDASANDDTRMDESVDTE